MSGDDLWPGDLASVGLVHGCHWLVAESCTASSAGALKHSWAFVNFLQSAVSSVEVGWFI